MPSAIVARDYSFASIPWSKLSIVKNQLQSYAINIKCISFPIIVCFNRGMYFYVMKWWLVNGTLHYGEVGNLFFMFSRGKCFWEVRRSSYTFLYILDENVWRNNCSKLTSFQPFFNCPIVHWSLSRQHPWCLRLGAMSTLNNHLRCMAKSVRTPQPMSLEEHLMHCLIITRTQVLELGPQD